MKSYLDDLGIANFEFVDIDIENTDKQQTQNQAKIINTKFLIIEKDNELSFLNAGKSRDLLTKMLLAIGVEIDKTTCINISEIDNYNAEIMIFAGDFASEEFIIPHPFEILNTPDLKRDAWEVLKKIKEIL
jgi:hypothetical protein